MPQLISWHELFEPMNGFIKDGAITVELEIKTKVLHGSTILNASKRKATSDQPATKHLKLTCEICKKTISDQGISSLPCGHVYYSSCINESVKGQKKCPSCDVRVIQNGLSRILLH